MTQKTENELPKMDKKVTLPNGSVAFIVSYIGEDELETNLVHWYSGDITVSDGQKYLHALGRGLQYLTMMNADKIAEAGVFAMNTFQQKLGEEGDDAQQIDLFTTLPEGEA